MRSRNYLGLPSFGLNAFALGLGIFLVLLGIKAVKTSDMALKVANTSFVTNSSARKLEVLAEKLEQQAVLIRQKDKAYQELKAIYEQSLKGDKGYEKLQKAIETIEQLPEVEDVTGIQTEIQSTEEILQETIDRE